MKPITASETDAGQGPPPLRKTAPTDDGYEEGGPLRGLPGTDQGI